MTYVRHVDIVDKQSWHWKILVVCQRPCRMILHMLRRERFAKQYGISITGPLLRDAEMNPSVAKLQIFFWYLKQQHTSTSWELTYPLPVWHFWVDFLSGFPMVRYGTPFHEGGAETQVSGFARTLSLCWTLVSFWACGAEIMKGFKGRFKHQTFQLCRTMRDCFIWQYQFFWIQLQQFAFHTWFYRTFRYNDKKSSCSG